MSTPKISIPLERAGILINKLKEQFEQGIASDKLLLTAQMLLQELQGQPTSPKSNSKISVVMPAVSTVHTEGIDINFLDQKHPRQPKKEDQSGWLFDPVTTIPTLVHQPELVSAEINDIMATESRALNDTLKKETNEIASVLQTAPIRDLKKAIGLNDRYLFINELFRGDETMYERSIKTINSFSILPEAEYWISRELKTKLGWTDSHEVVKLFDQLVKRRFS